MNVTSVPMNVSGAVEDMFPRSVPTSVDPVYVGVEVFLGVMSLLFNGALLFTIARVRRLRQFISTTYIAALALADLLVGAVVTPFAILTSVGLPTHFPSCLFMNSTLLFFTNCSTFCLLAVSIDRYLAITKPFWYQSHMSQTKAVGIICSMWCLAAVAGYLPLLGWNLGHPPVPRCFFMEVIDMKYMAFKFVFCTFTPTVIMATFYTVIFINVRKQIRSIAQVEAVLVRTQQQEQSGDSRPKMNKHWKREVRAAFTLAVVIVWFCICWYPIEALDTVLAFCPTCGPPLRVILTFIYLSHSNSAVSPLLYVISNKDFRSAMTEAFRGRSAANSSLSAVHINSVAN